MPYQTTQEAIAALSNVGATQSEIVAFVRQLSVDATGSTTVLYSGVVGDVPAWQIVEDMGDSVRHIGRTVASEVLNSNEFKAKVAQAFGLVPDARLFDALAANHPAKEWLNKGGSGPWAVASEMFVDATTGKVRLLTQGPASGSVLMQNELPRLLDRLRSGTGITEVDGVGRDDLLRVGASYTSNWTETMRNALLSNAITQTHLSRPGINSSRPWLDLTPDRLRGLYESADAAQHKALVDLLGALPVPRAATRALSRLGVIGGIVGGALMTTQASAAELAGDHDGAKAIVTDWVLDAVGSSAGQVVGAAVGAAALTAAAAAGAVISAPVAGALVLGAALIGGFFGAEGAGQLYRLLNDRDANGRRDVLDRLNNLLFGAGSTLTTPLVVDLNGARFTIDASLTRAEIVANARDSIAWRYALRELNPFVITDIDYAAHNADGSLDLVAADGEGAMSEQYLADRAAMLTWRIRYDADGARDDNDASHPGPKPYTEEWDTSQIDGNWDFVDLGLRLPGGQTLQLSIDGTGLSLFDHQVLFGSAAAETVEGSGDSDRLYGGAGDDTVNGSGGADYLEGNAGNDSLSGGAGDDTVLGGGGDDLVVGGEGNDRLVGGRGTDIYSFESGWGADVIEDSDGSGSIQIEGIGPLRGTGAVRLAGSTWRTSDSRITYSLVPREGGGNDLVIRFSDRSDTLRIARWTDGGLGIDLGGDVMPSVTTDSCVGDFIKATNEAGTDYVIAEDGNYVSAGAQPDAADILTGSAAADLIQGWGGNDGIAGGDGDDVIDGGDGADLILAGRGADIIDGGAGDDFIYGSDRGGFTLPTSVAFTPVGSTWGVEIARGFNWATYLNGTAVLQVGPDLTRVYNDVGNVIDGGAGRDLIYSGTGADVVHGGAGNDYLAGMRGDDVLYGDEGDDDIGGDASAALPSLYEYTAGELQGNDVISGGSGNDSLMGHGGNDQLFGGADDDELLGDGESLASTPGEFQGQDHLDGGTGNDQLTGGGRDDRLFGGEGNDRLMGDDFQDVLPVEFHGNDYLDGEAGDDTLIGQGGDDVLIGSEGNDVLNGDDVNANLAVAAHGNDHLEGGGGNDTLFGAGGEDALYGGADDDQLFGDGAEVDVPLQGHGADLLDGGEGNDLLFGQGGADQLFGGLGNDTLVGGEGDDYIEGEDGIDGLFGGDGNDTLVSDGGDYLDGGAGDDTLVIQGMASGVVATIDDASGNNDVYIGGAAAADNKVFSQDGQWYLSTSASSLVALGGNAALGGLNIRALGSDPTFTAGITVQAIVDASSANGLVRSGRWNHGVGLTYTHDVATAQNIVGGARAEWLEGGVGADEVDGGEGDDRLDGGAGADALYGGTGADALRGGVGDDTLEAGRQGRNDAAADVYLFGRGDGTDLIRAGNLPDGAVKDVIRFDAGIMQADISVSAILSSDADDATARLVISYGGTDRIALETGAEGSIDRLEFADGSWMGMAEVLARLPAAAAGTVVTEGDDFIHGTSGNDILRGRGGNDTLVGGEGDDTLQGDSGHNTYRFALASGHDAVIAAPGERALLVFEGVSASQIAARIEGNNLILLSGGASSVQVIGFSALTGGAGSWQIRADDGQTISVANLLAAQQAGAAPASLEERRLRFLAAQQIDLRTLPQRTVNSAGSVPRGVSTLDLVVGSDAALAFPDYLNESESSVTVVQRSRQPLYQTVDSLGSNTVAGQRFVPLFSFSGYLPPGSVPVYGPAPPTSSAGPSSAADGQQLLGYFMPTQATGVTQTTPQYRIVGYEDVVSSYTQTRASDTAVQMRVAGSAADDRITASAGDSPAQFRGSIEAGAGHDVISLLSYSNGVSNVYYNYARVLTRYADWGAAALFHAIPPLSGMYERGRGAWVDAGSGDDVVSGTDGHDVVIGGEGSDWLDGQAGADTYLIGRHAGAIDHVSDVAAFADPTGGMFEIYGGRLDRLAQDTIEFDASIDRSQLGYRWTASAESGLSGQGGYETLELFHGGAVFLQIDYAADMANRGTRGSAGIERFVFSDGQEWTLTQLLQSLPVVEPVAPGGGPSETVYVVGGSGNDVLVGGAANERMYGEGGDDMLDGRAGNDVMEGGEGADVYRFGRGSGQDSIYNHDSDGLASEDVLRLGTGITPSDIRLVSNAGSAVLGILNTSDSLSIESVLADDVTINAIEFDNGARWDLSTIRAQLLLGGDENEQLFGYAGADLLEGRGGDDQLIGREGNDSLSGGAGQDILYGEWGDDVLDGGGGADTLEGNEGADVYRFGRGYGFDRVYDDDGASNRIEFQPDVAIDQLWFRQAEGDLEVGLIGTDDQILVRNWYYGASDSMQSFRTSDGHVLLERQVQNLVDAMSAFAPPSAGQTTLPPDYRQALGATITASWQQAGG